RGGGREPRGPMGPTLLAVDQVGGDLAVARDAPAYRQRRVGEQPLGCIGGFKRASNEVAAGIGTRSSDSHGKPSGAFVCQARFAPPPVAPSTASELRRP